MRVLLCPASLKGGLSARAAAAARPRRSRGRSGCRRTSGCRRRRRDCRSSRGGARWRVASRSCVRSAGTAGAGVVAPPPGSPRGGRSSGRGRAALLSAERDPLRPRVAASASSCSPRSRAHPSRSCLRSEGSRPSTEGAGLREVVDELRIPTVALCDVRTTLTDAARLFGPQKGASEDGGRDPHESPECDRGASSVRGASRVGRGRRARRGACVAWRGARSRGGDGSRPSRLRFARRRI